MITMRCLHKLRLANFFKERAKESDLQVLIDFLGILGFDSPKTYHSFIVKSSANLVREKSILQISATTEFNKVDFGSVTSLKVNQEQLAFGIKHLKYHKLCFLYFERCLIDIIRFPEKYIMKHVDEVMFKQVGKGGKGEERLYVLDMILDNFFEIRKELLAIDNWLEKKKINNILLRMLFEKCCHIENAIIKGVRAYKNQLIKLNRFDKETLDKIISEQRFYGCEVKLDKPSKAPIQAVKVIDCKEIVDSKKPKQKGFFNKEKKSLNLRVRNK